MHLSRLETALVALLWCAAPAWAADLSKIDRTIAKEPAYQGQPKYCLLVFGPEARTPMWLVLDDKTLYLDRAGNGDLTDAVKSGGSGRWERVALGAVPDADGTLRQGNLTAERSSNNVELEVTVGNKVLYYVGWDSEDLLRFADRPGDAPIVHIGGPVTVCWYGKPPALVAGTRCRFFTRLGTPGLGKGSFAAVSACSKPADARLAAVIDYPPRDAAGSRFLKEYDLGED